MLESLPDLMERHLGTLAHTAFFVQQLLDSFHDSRLILKQQKSLAMGGMCNVQATVKLGICRET